VRGLVRNGKQIFNSVARTSNELTNVTSVKQMTCRWLRRFVIARKQMAVWNNRNFHFVDPDEPCHDGTLS